MRVVCMVPSWTETLIACGVNVVGRTRYCIHPAEQVADIAVVGGTKDVQWDKVTALAPDLVIFDKEENTREMADGCPFPYFATHLSSVQQMPRALRLLAQQLNNHGLIALAARFQVVLDNSAPIQPGALPLLEHKDAVAGSVLDDKRPWLYLIWRKPYMTIGRHTYIFSVFSLLGLADRLIALEPNYPALDIEEIQQLNPVLLCSTEPYPFAKQLATTQQELQQPAVLLDGEPLCWYGIRCLRYLESLYS
ncbi:ABC transporter substrate-binding protein [Oceanisphaera marina]|uniref:ABC transporter substrate-binding protein n=1 Tax=Oceanisphaera marina TaxID=2017550 RepID=A0ABQ1IWR0_9GAMM|nr:helical backbone metal receptor [Oceanisphaera marina]GGB53799.1 ABC transporter substrate-binding protein [Oceanisphaera marina]